MSKYWNTEILTTCALDYVTWKNHYSPGVAEVSLCQGSRFRVAQQRNTKSFNAMSETIYSRLEYL